jgi:hypothetical protein
MDAHEAMGPGNVELRLAGGRDAAALRRVAERDSRALPPGPHLLVVRGGRIDAALCLSTGEAVADPFVRTAELIELLRCHARAVTPPPAGERSPARPRVRMRAVTT